MSTVAPTAVLDQHLTPIHSVIEARIDRLLEPSRGHLRVLPRPSFEATCRHLLLSFLVDYSATGWPGGNKVTAKLLNTDPRTVGRWLRSLADDGLIERRNGRWHVVADAVRQWLRKANADFAARGLHLTHGFLPRSLLRSDMTPERLTAAAILLGETFGNVSSFVRGDEERAQLANVSRRTVRAAREDLEARGIVRAAPVRRGRLTLTKMERLPGCRVTLRYGDDKLDSMARRASRARGASEGCADAQRKGCADAHPSPQCPSDGDTTLRGQGKPAAADVDLEQQVPTEIDREAARRAAAEPESGVGHDRVEAVVEQAVTGTLRRGRDERQASQRRHAAQLLADADLQHRAIEEGRVAELLTGLGMFDGSHLTRAPFGKLAADYAGNRDRLAECLTRRHGSEQAAARDVLSRARRVFRNRNVANPQAVLLHELCADLRRSDELAAAAAKAARDARHGLDRRTHGAVVGALMARDFAAVAKRVELHAIELHALAVAAVGDAAPSLDEITTGLAGASTAA